MEAMNQSGQPRSSRKGGPMQPAPLTCGGLALEEVTCRGWGTHLQYSLPGVPQTFLIPHPPTYTVQTHQQRTGDQCWTEKISVNGQCACVEPFDFFAIFIVSLVTRVSTSFQGSAGLGSRKLETRLTIHIASQPVSRLYSKMILHSLT